MYVTVRRGCTHRTLIVAWYEGVGVSQLNFAIMREHNKSVCVCGGGGGGGGMAIIEYVYICVIIY